MGIFDKLFGNSISVNVTREEFEAYEKEQRAILEKARKETEAETNAALEEQRRVVAERLKKSALEAGPGKLRRLGWFLSDICGVLAKVLTNIFGFIATRLAEVPKFLNEIGIPISVVSVIVSVLWMFIFWGNYNLGFNFLWTILVSIPLGAAVLVALVSGSGIASLFMATGYCAAIYFFTHVLVVSPNSSWVAVRKEAGKTVVEDCRNMPFFMKWDEKQYLATTFFNKDRSWEIVSIEKLELLNTKVGISAQLSFYPESRRFAEVYDKKIDSNKELAKTKEIVAGLITSALREVEKRDDVIQEAKNGFPQTIVQNCLVNLLRARLHDATKDCYWHVDENSPVGHDQHSYGVNVYVLTH